MTSRLKHKLELDQVNLNSAYLNESFVQVGTPLPALANTKKDKLEYVPEWKQEVTDEQGRRRFHGAFTGGYSAGYYNTVGSKEGWAPSTFKSSRTNRANKVQRPEDFMDDEDIQQMKEDRRLENTETFKDEGFAGQREPLADRNLPSALESLIAPAQSSIGQQLLQKLGWRPGQGIGPRVTLRRLRIQEGKLGKSRLGTTNENEPMDEEVAGKHTFAPRDVRLLVYEGKGDKMGLGYEKGRGLNRLPSAAGPRFMNEDDDDPYSAGPSGSHYAFDNHEQPEDEIITLGPKAGLGSSTSRPSSTSVSHDTWHDGRPILPRFVLDPKGVPQDTWFPMPEIPADWRPRPARVWGTTRKWDEQPGEKKMVKPSIRGEPGRPLRHDQRGAALGEETRISQAQSVFEWINQKDKERLASLASQAPPPPPLSLQPQDEDPSAPRAPATSVEIPPLSPRTASAALKGYVPYGDDVQKQERYKSYLFSQTYNTKQPNPTLLPSGSMDDINAELQSFAESARIFKPMPFAMSSRFTAGSSSLAASDLKQAKPGLHIFDAEKAKAAIEAAKAEEPAVEQKILTPREQAAKDGNWGRATRESKVWYPVKLVCKRFGVADPHPEGPPAEQAAGASSGKGTGMEGMPLPSNDASWESKFIHKPTSPSSSQKAPPQGQVQAGGERQPTNISEVGMADDINQGRDTLTYEKPSIDIFKAIFADDEDDDEDEDENGEVDKIETEVPAGRELYQDPFPPPKAPSPREEKPVDLATFKPVFSRKRDRDRDDEGSKEDRKKDKKDRKNKKRKSQGVLSFDVGEDGEEDEPRERDMEKKKKKPLREEKRGGDREDEESREKIEGDGSVEDTHKKKKDDVEGYDEGDWIEKPAIVPRLAGRKGAADFM
ncbi:hypothetical protein I350_04254 [Cryptococcus amylolentus CBS 6273]|uniref:G-patch domain-containing protein n=1 Tax=Cryptococcus amylolentus CBS 6273 TaxID=1296118 RepID=A0A1E3K180_9TREE|nr:hypothetical protein I350_04254 [Cryptococcus amylolentus CBS 6273]